MQDYSHRSVWHFKYLHEGSKCIRNAKKHQYHSFLLCDVLMWIYSIQHLNILLSFVSRPCRSCEHCLFVPFVWKHLWLPIIHPCSIEAGFSCWTKVFKQHQKATSIVSPAVVVLQCMHHAWSASEWVLSLYNVWVWWVYFLVQVKTEEQIAAEQAWYGSEKVWLVHKDGFSLGEFQSYGTFYLFI